MIIRDCDFWFISDRLKRWGKWPYSIIFGNLTWGGFDILMSRWSQVEKNLAFHRILPKWHNGSSLSPAWVGWALRYPLKQPKMLKNILGCLLVFCVVEIFQEGCLSVFRWHFYVSELIGGFRGISEGSVHAGWSWAGDIMQFWKILWGASFFHLTSLRLQNIKTSLCEVSKNYWVRPFSPSFKSVRDKSKVTVSFDHPVSS